MEGTCFESTGRRWPPALSALRGLLGRLHQVGSDRLGPMFAELDELKLLAEAVQVGVLDAGPVPWGRPGLGRGVAGRVGAPVGPSYVAGGAAALVRVTEAIAQPRNGVLREAVLGARVPVRNAAVALTEMDKLRPRLTPEWHEHGAGGVRDPGRVATGRGRSGRCARR